MYDYLGCDISKELDMLIDIDLEVGTESIKGAATKVYKFIAKALKRLWEFITALAKRVYEFLFGWLRADTETDVSGSVDEILEVTDKEYNDEGARIASLHDASRVMLKKVRDARRERAEREYAARGDRDKGEPDVPDDPIKTSVITGISTSIYPKDITEETDSKELVKLVGNILRFYTELVDVGDSIKDQFADYLVSYEEIARVIDNKMQGSGYTVAEIDEEFNKLPIHEDPVLSKGTIKSGSLDEQAREAILGTGPILNEDTVSVLVGVAGSKWDTVTHDATEDVRVTAQRGKKLAGRLRGWGEENEGQIEPVEEMKGSDDPDILDAMNRHIIKINQRHLIYSKFYSSRISRILTASAHVVKYFTDIKDGVDADVRQVKSLGKELGKITGGSSKEAVTEILNTDFGDGYEIFG